MSETRGRHAAATIERGTDHAELRLSLLFASIYAIVGVQLPFFSIWLSGRGLDALQIAAILAVQPVIRIGSTLIASRRADRHGDHGAMLVACAAGVAAGYAATGLSHGFAAILCMVALVALAQGPIAPLADGISFEQARRRRELGLPQMHYSWVRGWGSVSILIFLAASGPIAGALPGEDIIWLLAGVGALSCLWSLAALIGLRHAAPICALRRNPPVERPGLVILLIAAATLIQSSHSMVNAFGALHWKQMGHSDTFVAFAWVVALATEVAAFLMAGRWFGGEARAVSFLMVGGVAAVFRWMLMSLDLNPAGIFFAQALHGASCAAVQIGPAYLLAALGGRERQAQAQAWLAAAIAGGNGLFTLLSGPLYTMMGEHAYLAMAGFAFLGTLLSFGVAKLADEWRASTHIATAEPQHSGAA
ncbi:MULTISPECIES: MFS transporter [Methylosinus]|uniref:MFS transporter n=1 Tax=Methylosinus trichosporium (strain ATCC 35070 / NCIMB 11131 / UNIQEM 75 / OB3b) TaxID=595536 RepID=A0A2D2D2I0_METT3|nr:MULTISPECIES: MFS transporter [Methylosinus]ATQ69221.1 MFS transporter [Methylosinus trichosporium OB3b]